VTKEELLILLNQEGVPREYYSLEGGGHDNRLCMERRSNRWYVYCCENGKRTREKDFLWEEAACLHFYEELMKKIGKEANTRATI